MENCLGISEKKNFLGISLEIFHRTSPFKFLGDRLTISPKIPNKLYGNDGIFFFMNFTICQVVEQFFWQIQN